MRFDKPCANHHATHIEASASTRVLPLELAEELSHLIVDRLVSLLLSSPRLSLARSVLPLDVVGHILGLAGCRLVLNFFKLLIVLETLLEVVEEAHSQLGGWPPC